MNSFQGNKSNAGKNDTKRRDYLIQQEKLRSMAQSATGNKALNADSMIENLLSRSETFMKHKEAPHQGLPAWLTSNSSSLPKVYKNVWLSVKSKNLAGPQQFCDTQFLTSILLTSGISTECLGHIWALCNKTAPGLMTEQELYQVLALVALAQLGRPWNNLEVLQKAQEPVVPCLNYNLLAMSPPAPDPGIHSTYFPSRMAMSIPSPIQMFQNTTNSVLSNNKTSLELNPSLLESMLSNNYSQENTSAPSLNPQGSKPPGSLSRKESDDFSDNWTDFMDHTASMQTKLAPSVTLNNPAPLLGDSSLVSEKANLVFDTASQKSIGFDQLSLLDSGLSAPIMADTSQLDFADDFSSLTLTSSNVTSEKADHENDDEFADFQSFDLHVENYLKNSRKPKDETSSLESIMKINSESYPKAPKKPEPKSSFLSPENDEVVYGQKGYVVENPLYLSDNDSIYDNNSVSSLKFDSISLDTDSNQGLNLFTSVVPLDKSKSSSGAESEKSSQFIQVPSLISANTSEDKYSVFRMLDIDENLSKAPMVNDDDFGDFLTADFTEPKVEKLSPPENILDSPSPTFLSEPIAGADQKAKLDFPQTQSLQETCVDACISVLRNAVNKFASLNPDVLKLVLCEDKCIDYIQALTEIYRIAERMIPCVNNGLYKDNLNNVWKDLNSYVSTKFSVEECEEENDYSCTLCNTSSGSAVIKYGMSYYHVPCINFYLNCVNSNLPD